MKRHLWKNCACALLALALLCGCAALAEADVAEIVDLQESAVGSVEVSQGAEAPGESPDAQAAAETPEAPGETPLPPTVRIGFEDGFALELPEGWLFHRTTPEMAEQSVVYCLSDAEGAGWLYIQSWTTDCASLDELKALIDRAADIQTSGIYNFNGVDFVVYDLTEGDVSCCAALRDGKVLNLVFTPQSDAGFMAVAAQILNTFEIL